MDSRGNNQEMGNHIPNVCRRSANEDLERSLLGDPSVERGIVVSNSMLVETDSDMAGFSGRKSNLFEGNKFLLWSGKSGPIVANINLDNLRAIDSASVANSHDDVDSSIFRENTLLEFGSAVLESRVRKTVSEGKEWLDLDSLVVPVADENTFTIYNLEVLPRPGVISRCILDPLRESALRQVS